jgi:hypothetical protein
MSNTEQQFTPEFSDTAGKLSDAVYRPNCAQNELLAKTEIKERRITNENQENGIDASLM